MAGWALTLGLQNLRSQVNERFPGRDKKSDGTIGDVAHQAESASGHNPDDTAGSRPEWNSDADKTPEVRAWDMDSDLGEPGTTAQMVVDHIRTLPGISSVLRYMIYNRKMYSASSGWISKPYSGASAHTEHIHFSGAYTQTADNNTSFDFKLEDINMPSAKEIVDALLAKDLGKPGGGDTVAVALQSGYANSQKALEKIEAMEKQLTALTTQVDALAKKP